MYEPEGIEDSGEDTGSEGRKDEAGRVGNGGFVMTRGGM